MLQSTKKLDRLFNGPGIHLKQTVCNKVDYYKNVERIITAKQKSATKEMDFPGIEKSPKNFLLI